MAYRHSSIICLFEAGVALLTTAGFCQVVDTHVVNESAHAILVNATIAVVVLHD